MRNPRALRLWPLVCLLNLVPHLALAQQPRPAGEVTALKGEATMARATAQRLALARLTPDEVRRERKQATEAAAPAAPAPPPPGLTPTVASSALAIATTTATNWTSNLCVQRSTITTAAPLEAGTPSTGRSFSGILETSFGPSLSALQCDDCSTIVSFGFSFPFRGERFTTAELSTNGYLFPGNGTTATGTTAPCADYSICCDDTPGVSTFTSRPNRIAVAWDDLDAPAT